MFRYIIKCCYWCTTMIYQGHSVWFSRMKYILTIELKQFTKYQNQSIDKSSLKSYQYQNFCIQRGAYWIAVVEFFSWWLHQIEIFPALLDFCVGNSTVTGKFPSQRPVTRSFYIFFDLRMNKRLSKNSTRWWFETQSYPLWRHCNVMKQTLLVLPA